MRPSQQPEAAPPELLPTPQAILGRAGGENFPVASRLLPKAQRQDLLALYGFARLADEIGDGDQPPADILAALNWLDAEIDRAAGGRARHPLLVAAGDTIRRHHLDPGLFHQLVQANRQDQTVRRYSTFDQLVDYCRLSATPVGRMVLGVLQADSAERAAWSDDVCVALQLVEHCQDVFEDAGRDRIYLPAEDLALLGCDEADITAARPTDALRAVVALQIDRSRRLLGAGAPLAASLPGRFRLAVAAFAAGGLGAADELRRRGYAPLSPGAGTDTRRRLRRLGSLLWHTTRLVAAGIGPAVAPAPVSATRANP